MNSKFNIDDKVIVIDSISHNSIILSVKKIKKVVILKDSITYIMYTNSSDEYAEQSILCLENEYANHELQDIIINRLKDFNIRYIY